MPFAGNLTWTLHKQLVGDTFAALLALAVVDDIFVVVVAADIVVVAVAAADIVVVDDVVAVDDMPVDTFAAVFAVAAAGTGCIQEFC